MKTCPNCKQNLRKIKGGYACDNCMKNNVWPSLFRDEPTTDATIAKAFGFKPISEWKP